MRIIDTRSVNNYVPKRHARLLRRNKDKLAELVSEGARLKELLEKKEN